jgi:ABC-type multidrug transport system fused ATPase/permease subunit
MAEKFGLSLNLPNVLVFIMFVFVAQSAVKFGADLFVARLHVRFQKDLMKNLYHNYFKARWPFFYENKLGDLVNPVVSEADRAASAVQYFGKLLADLFMAISYAILAILVSWKLTVGAVVVGIIASFLSRGLMMRAEKYGVATTEANTATQSRIVDMLSSAKIIKASATEEYATGILDSTIKQRLIYRFKSLLNASLIPAIYGPLTIGIVCLGIYMSITFFSLRFSFVILLLALFYRLMPRVSSIQSTFQLFLTCAPGLAEIDRKVSAATSFCEKSGQRIFDSLSDSIRLIDVNFCYDDRHENVTLRNINMVIENGKITALVGGSGGGKSTLVDICLGLLQPDSGRILVDDEPLVALDKKSYRRAIGYVSQDVQLLNGTVRSNIAWVRPDATSLEIEKAAKRAYAHDFITELPDGYETQIGDRGVRLSGGQRQRICLARALLQNPKILILDEATSALDAESEHKIHHAVMGLRGEVTILIVAHRLATVMSADVVYVIEKGEIIERGTWEELVSQGNRFEQLRKLQALK